MRLLLQRVFKKTIIRLADKYSSRPDKARVNMALTKLYQSILNGNEERGKLINLEKGHQPIIILSDQHKGARNGEDDFALAEQNYLAALAFYNHHHYHYINLGDSEELWKNSFSKVKKCNKATFAAEQRFIDRQAFIKLFGNHDLYWDNSPLALLSLQQIYGRKINVYEGVVLKVKAGADVLHIYLTHGHQGDKQSDGNWLSKWLISNIVGPLLGYLNINPNTPANNDTLKTAHNQIMYEWSAQQQHTMLITGHTHQPVFKSLTHLEKLYQLLDKAKFAEDGAKITQLEQQIRRRHAKGDSVISFKDYKPTYFNSGCCCFDDGDITGIEIANGNIRLVKWQYQNGAPQRRILDECALHEITGELVPA